jgi:ribonuclease E
VEIIQQKDKKSLTCFQSLIVNQQNQVMLPKIRNGVQMTNKLMLINVTDDESRIGIVEDSVLQEMLIEHETREQIKNNIYKGVVVQVQTALQAAFVDFGNKKHGFLPASEINPGLYKNKKLKGNRHPIQKILKPGQSIVVQVTREAVDNKGAALSTNISLPGRFMVLMPDTKKGGISKKIENAEERDRLKGFISGIESEDHAVIIRTAGIGRNLVELTKDYTTLKKTWEEIQSKAKTMTRSGLIQEEDDVVTRTLRDYYTEDIKEIWVDNAEIFQKALQFLKKTTPRRQKNLKLFVGDRSLFATYNIEKQVEQLTDREIHLKSGGSVVIEQTEALVSIDVNSGKSNQEGSIDETALRTNLEAANELARQLRLRNLAGLIVIDFIDMETEQGRRKVEQEIQNAMSRDKAQRKYNPISQFGLMEMSRQRLSVGISRTIESICPVCNGKGRIASILAATNLIIRKIREMAAKGSLYKIEGELPLDVANHLLNERRKSITDLEFEFDIQIIIKSNPELLTLNDQCIKPFHLSTPSSQQEKSPILDQKQKPESSKKKNKKQHIDKKSAKSKEQHDQKPELIEIEPEPVETSNNDTAKDVTFVGKTVKEPQKAPVKKAPKNKKPQKSKVKEQEKVELTLHPSCLFQDVQELSPDDLEEVTSSFENRLKGKIDNQLYSSIDSKFLWSPNTEGKTQDKVEDKPNDKPINKKSTTKSKPKHKKKTATVEKSKSEKTTSTKKPSKKAATQKKEPKEIKEKVVTKQKNVKKPAASKAPTKKVAKTVEKPKKKPATSRKPATQKASAKAKKEPTGTGKNSKEVTAQKTKSVKKVSSTQKRKPATPKKK